MRVPIVLVAVVAPAVLASQGSYGIAGSVGFVGPSHYRGSNSPAIQGSEGLGYRMTAFYAVQMSPLVAARIEASLSDLPLVTGFVGVMCPYDPNDSLLLLQQPGARLAPRPPATAAAGTASNCCGLCAVRGYVGVASLTAHAVLRLGRSGIASRFYVIAGAGPVYVMGEEEGSVQLSGSGGLGCTFPVNGRSQLFAELRLEKWLAFDSTNWPWMVPLTVGLRL